MIDQGTIIDGRYKVISRVGSGGMADVYLAEDQLLGRQVALKLLHPHFAEDQEFVERFRREASSAAGLSHQNIVGIFDRGEWQGTYYIAMEYVAGRSLKSVVREQGPLEPALAIDIVVQVLRAARFAHRRGVIHRDLKPHNVILDEDGRARVTDFGIARAGASDMTLTGSIMGTAQYLSPEQAQGHVVSGASDLYSIGVILYELLTGVVPFEGDTAVAIAFKQVSAEPRAPSSLNPGVPPELDAIVLRALAKDPARRFADADEFIAALQQARGRLGASTGAAALSAAATGDQPRSAGVLAPPPAAGAIADPAHAQGGDGTHPSGALLLPAAIGFEQDPDHPPEGDGARRWWLVAGVLALLIAAGIAAALLLASGPGHVNVPEVTGQSEATASSRLRAAGLTPVSSLNASATLPAGRVLSQTPARGTRVSRGSRVSIVVSSGPPSAALPSVAGLSGAVAERRLRDAGYKPSTSPQASSTVADGRVIGTDPPAGTDVQLSSPVVVLVSSGPAQLRVPDVTGDSERGAEAALSAVGLSVGTVTRQVSSAQAAGNVLAQSPSAGSSLATGSSVDLTLATASNEVAVPKVVGKNETEAAAALGGAGFTPKLETRTVTSEAPVETVLRQSPAGGKLARKGATVTLTVGVRAPSTPTTPTGTTTTPTTSTPAPVGANPAPGAAG